MSNQKIFNIISEQVPNPLLLEESKSSFCDEFIFDYCKSINCSNSKTFCNNCSNCKRIDQKTYFDFFYFDAYNNSVLKEEVFNALNQFKYSSLEASGNKFFVFKGIELANQQITNLMLRTIEEPNKNTYFIFVTRNKNAVLETIISRCNVYTLQKDLDKTIDILKRNNVDQKHYPFLLESFFSTNEMLNFYNSKSFKNILEIYQSLKDSTNKIVAIKNINSDFKSLSYLEIEKLLIMFSLNIDVFAKTQIFALLNNLKSNPNKTLVFNELINILRII